MPNIEINFTSIAVAIFTCFMLCYVWFTPLFGTAWKKGMGFSNEPEPSNGQLFKSLGLTLIGIVFMVFVLSNNIQVWMPKTWGIAEPALPIIEQAFMAAFFSWLGFVIPVLLNQVAWARHSRKLFLINAGYYFVALLISAFILLIL